MESLQNELVALRKKLALLENRNIAMKTQLAHILQYHFDRSLLDKLEYFNTTFLQQDTRVEALRQEIALQQVWLAQAASDGASDANIQKHQWHMQEKLHNMEADVQRLTQSFSDYLQTHFPSVPKSSQY